MSVQTIWIRLIYPENTRSEARMFGKLTPEWIARGRGVFRWHPHGLLWWLRVHQVVDLLVNMETSERDAFLGASARLSSLQWLISFVINVRAILPTQTKMAPRKRSWFKDWKPRLKRCHSRPHFLLCWNLGSKLNCLSHFLPCDGWMEFLYNYHQPPEGKNHVGLLLM